MSEITPSTMPTIDCAGCGGLGQIDPGSAAACPLCDGTGKTLTNPAAIDLDEVRALRSASFPPELVDTWCTLIAAVEALRERVVKLIREQELNSICTIDRGEVQEIFERAWASEDKVKTLQDQLIWGFYETDDGSPEYTQGSKKLHELHELVTADECNGLVKTIKALEEKEVKFKANLQNIDELLARRPVLDDKPSRFQKISHALYAAARCDAAEVKSTCIQKTLEKVRQCCLFDDDEGKTGVTTDPHIPLELFDEICAVLRTPASPAGNGD